MDTSVIIPHIPVELSDVLSRDPEVMHGQVCFRGTRVPLAVLLDNLEEGMGLEEFVAEYPSVERDQAAKILKWKDLSGRV